MPGESCAAAVRHRDITAIRFNSALPKPGSQKCVHARLAAPYHAVTHYKTRSTAALAQVNCTTWSQCSGGHLFEFCVVDGMSHNIPGRLKPDQTTFIRAGSDVDWTKRTFERFSLLVQPGQLLFYGQPTAEELDYHYARWPPPKLTDHQYIRNPGTP